MNVRLLLVPYDSGHRAWRAGAGPGNLALPVGTALERAGHAVDIETVEVDTPALEIAVSFALATRLASAVASATAAGALPLVLAGNCISCLGTTAGVGTADLGVAWFDAHGDFNTPETSTSGMLDGMALATLAGRCWQGLAERIPGFAPLAERRVLQLAARDLDAPESAALAAAPLLRLATSELRRRELVAAAAAALREAGARRLYVHVDLDALEGSRWPANGFACAGGPTPSELAATVGWLGEAMPIAAAALTAYDPAADPTGTVRDAAVEIAVALVAASPR